MIQKIFLVARFRDFGTGVAGICLFIFFRARILSPIQKGRKIFSSGQLSYWKDGRNVPDVMSGILQYPETPEHPAFQLTLQVNFVSGTGSQESTQLVGEEGVMD